MLKHTTPVPNVLLDNYLPHLKEAELKVLLVIVRSTNGWVVHRGSKARKTVDWISGKQLRERTGCSKRSITTALKGLVELQIVRVRDADGNILDEPSERKGKTRLYYQLSKKRLSPPTQNLPTSWAKSALQLAQNLRITKENSY